MKKMSLMLYEFLSPQTLACVKAFSSPYTSEKLLMKLQEIKLPTWSYCWYVFYRPNINSVEVKKRCHKSLF